MYSTIEKIDLTIDRMTSRACSPAPVGVAVAQVDGLSRTGGGWPRSFLPVVKTEVPITEASGEDSARIHRDRSVEGVGLGVAPMAATPFVMTPNAVLFARTTYDPGSQPCRQPV